MQFAAHRRINHVIPHLQANPANEFGIDFRGQSNLLAVFGFQRFGKLGGLGFGEREGGCHDYIEHTFFLLLQEFKLAGNFR